MVPCFPMTLNPACFQWPAVMSSIDSQHTQHSNRSSPAVGVCAGTAKEVPAPSLALLLPAQGEQVFISYGPQANDSLLQFYGFVEAGNPHDTYRVRDVAARARAVAASMGQDVRSERSTAAQEGSGAEAAVRLIASLHACNARRPLQS